MAKLIKVEELENGMVLAHPLINRYGQILLPGGTQLEMKHQMLLRTWGIKTLFIQQDGEEEEEVELNSDMKKNAEEKLNKRLMWKPGSPIETDLYQMAINKILKLY
jgi:hypothetical protein